MFESFHGINPLQYNPYTQSVWKRAVEDFYQRISAAEKLMAERIREKLRLIETNYHMIVIELEKYLDLIRIPSMKKALLAERQMVLGHFVNYVKAIKTDFAHKTKMIEQGEGVCLFERASLRVVYENELACV